MAEQKVDKPVEPLRKREVPPWAGPLIALLVLVVYTIAHELVRDGATTFARPDNIINILKQNSFVGIIAVGMTLALTLGGIDLSVGSLVAFAGGLGIWLMNAVIDATKLLESVKEAAEIGIANEHGRVPIAIAETAVALHIGGSEAWGFAIAAVTILLAATLAGLLNGTLIAKARVSPLIVTLGGLAAYRSLALALADGGEFRSSSKALFAIPGNYAIPFPGLADGMPLPIVGFACVIVIGAVLLNRTRFGRYVTAIGCNERAAIYSAINVTRVKIAAYALVGAAAGVAAMLVSSRMNSVSSAQTGQFYELDAIAAVVIGGTRMSGGSGTIVGTVIGVLILGVIANMLVMLDAPVYLQGLVKGVIIVAAVMIQRPGRDR